MKYELTEPFAAPEFFIDGFTDFEVKDGLLTYSAYRLQHDVPVLVYRAIMRINTIMAGMEEAREAVNAARFANIQAANIKYSPH